MFNFDKAILKSYVTPPNGYPITVVEFDYRRKIAKDILSFYNLYYISSINKFIPCLRFTHTNFQCEVTTVTVDDQFKKLQHRLDLTRYCP